LISGVKKKATNLAKLILAVREEIYAGFTDSKVPYSLKVL